ncbi:hypothetical protein ANRL3_03018 [Anaerolineae bacterium]|nr:hypothetical protein ANRL3_03018 [Anaerolineae bacterium]
MYTRKFSTKNPKNRALRREGLVVKKNRPEGLAELSFKVASDGHVRIIYSPVLDGKRHISDEAIASILDNLSA